MNTDETKRDAQPSAASAGSISAQLRPYYDRDGITIYHGDCMAILHEDQRLAAAGESHE